MPKYPEYNAKPAKLSKNATKIKKVESDFLMPAAPTIENLESREILRKDLCKKLNNELRVLAENSQKPAQINLLHEAANKVTALSKKMEGKDPAETLKEIAKIFQGIYAEQNKTKRTFGIFRAPSAMYDSLHNLEKKIAKHAFCNNKTAYKDAKDALKAEQKEKETPKPR